MVHGLLKQVMLIAMTALKWTWVVIAALAIILGTAALLFSLAVNPAVINEIRTNPTGQEAQEAMLLTLQGKTLPVNYLKEGDTVFMGVDGRWWRAFTGGPTPVSMLIQGQTYNGLGEVVLDDPAYVEDVFSRLRPTAPEWLPAWLSGKLVVIIIETPEAG
ncbi:MAG: hypothetical protein ACI9P7_001038 [Candidatus Azotimanducaceae bacterium]|jgi:hypothetical protein